jgi:hypothetical protein
MKRSTSERPIELKRLMLGGAAALAVVAAHASASAQVIRDPPTPFGPLRYDDNFSDGANLTGVGDELKNIAVGSMSLDLGGSVRERMETVSDPNFGFGEPGRTGDTYLLSRILLDADLHVDSNVRVFVQFSDHEEVGRQPGPTPTDVDPFDLQQGFIEIDSSDHADGLRIGRQEMMYGSNRLVDIREGPNIRQAFDGVRGWLAVGDGKLDLFWTRPTANGPSAFDDQPDPHQEFWGAYYTTPVKPVSGLGIDFYYFGLRRIDAVLDAGVGNENRHTLGSRVFGHAGAIDYNFEADYQFGDFSNRSIQAYAVFSDTGYTFDSAWGRPRLALKADVASGGDSRGNGALGTFYPLFPKNNYFSEANIQTPMNYIDGYPYVSIQPMRSVAFMVGLEFLWRQNTKDSFYAPPGIPILPGNADNRRGLGNLLNSVVEWQATPNINMSLVYARQEAGPYIAEAGGQDIDFGALWATFNF